MKINNSEALIRVIKAEWVEVTKEQFDVQFLRQNGNEYFIGEKHTWSLGTRPFLLYCGNTKKYYMEQSQYEAIQPRRKEGWYRGVIKNGKVYNNKEVVAYYMKNTEKFYCQNWSLKESDFEWVDDNPIEFPGEWYEPA